MEKTLPDLEKNGAQPSGTSQPETPDSADELEKEVDKVLTTTEDIDLSKVEPDEDGNIVLSKDEFGKLKSSRDNYKQGLTSLKPRFKELKKKVVQDPTKQPEKRDEQPINDTLSRKEFYLSNSRTAIEEVCKNPILEKHWDSIISSYSGRRGKATVKDIIEDINDAVAIWKERNPELAKELTDYKPERDLATGNSRSATDTSQKGTKEQVEKKRILPEKTSVQEWYPTKK